MSEVRTIGVSELGNIYRYGNVIGSLERVYNFPLRPKQFHSEDIKNFYKALQLYNGGFGKKQGWDALTLAAGYSISGINWNNQYARGQMEGKAFLQGFGSVFDRFDSLHQDKQYDLAKFYFNLADAGFSAENSTIADLLTADYVYKIGIKKFFSLKKGEIKSSDFDSFTSGILNSSKLAIEAWEKCMQRTEHPYYKELAEIVIKNNDIPSLKKRIALTRRELFPDARADWPVKLKCDRNFFKALKKAGIMLRDNPQGISQEVVLVRKDRKRGEVAEHIRGILRIDKAYYGIHNTFRVSLECTEGKNPFVIAILYQPESPKSAYLFNLSGQIKNENGENDGVEIPTIERIRLETNLFSFYSPSRHEEKAGLLIEALEKAMS